MKKTLTVSTWNLCNGLLNKMIYVKNMLKEERIDVLILQETQLKHDVNIDLLQVENYTIEMSTSTETTRVVMYLKSTICYERVYESQDHNVIMVNIKDNYSIEQIVGLYRPFKLVTHGNSVEQFKSQINEITNFLKDDKTKVILGDFNLDHHKKNEASYPQQRVYDELIELETAFDLHQLVREDTWSRDYNGVIRTSLLDHIYISNLQLVEQVEVKKIEISDHSVVILRTYGIIQSDKMMHYTYTTWKDYSQEALQEELVKYDLEFVDEADPEVMADYLDQVMGKIVDSLLKTITAVKPVVKCCYPAYIIEKRKKLNNLYKRAKKTKNLILMRRSRRMEKLLRREIVNIKTTKIRAEANLGPKNLWKAVKIAIDKPITTIPDLNHEGRRISNDKDKAEAFATFFNKKVKDIVEQVQIDDSVYNGERKIFGLYEEDWISEERVMDILANLEPKRCCGYDRVPLMFLNHGREKMCAFVTRLMKRVFATGIIPEQWKISKVIPLVKKGDTKSISNYRPISNLSSITKVFERLVLQRIAMIESVESVDLTGKSQHGFKKNRSTETACLEIQSEIATSCDENNYVIVSSIDMSAAFDVVDHQLLIKRLKIMGLPDNLISVIQNWLTNRVFYVEINGKVSPWMDIEWGTIQGSILGPILYALYTSPISDIVKLIVTYADDNYKINIDRSLINCVALCEENTSTMIAWFKKSGLKVNEQKTDFCVFHKNDTRSVTLTIDNQQYKSSNQMKILGVVFDTKLTWNEHVNKAISAANKAKQALKIISKYFSTEELIKLSTAYFYSRLYYGAKVWLMTSLKADLKKKLWQASSRMLQIVQKDINRQLSYDQLHVISKRASPAMWCSYVTACSMYDIIVNQVPENVLAKVTINYQPSTRRTGLLFTRSNKLKVGFNCLSNRLQLVSRELDIDVQSMSKNVFKMYCKRKFISYD